MLSPSWPGFRTPSDGDLMEVSWPGDAQAACRRGFPQCTSRQEVRYALAYGGRAVSDASAGSLRGCKVRITTKRPWWQWAQHAMSMPVRRRIMGFFAYPPKGYISAIRPANCDDCLNITC